MKVIVTGAAGFIGSHLCERLARSGHSILGIDNFDSYLYPARIKREHAAELLRATSGMDFDLIEADICSGEAMAQLITDSVDVVCHLAALAGVRPSLVSPERYMRTNVEGSTVLLKACRDAGVERVVFASSSSVYGAQRSAAPFQEADPCLHPASPYAASKRFGEILCSTYRDLYGIGTTVLRFFTVFGPRQRPDMAIHKFIHSVAAGRAICVYGDGRSGRDYTYVDDIVTGIVAAIMRVRPDSYEIFNLGGGALTELSELVSLVEETVGRSAIVEHLADQSGDVPITLADISLARTHLGYRPTVSVKDGIERYWQYCRSRFRRAGGELAVQG